MKKLRNLKKRTSTRVALQFQVEWGEKTMAFREASGLGALHLPLAIYKKGILVPKHFHRIKNPSTINFKKGGISSSKGLEALMSSMHTNGAEAKDMFIFLLGENHRRIKTWKVVAALPTKVQSPDLKADGNEVPVETVEIMHEGICIVN